MKPFEKFLWAVLILSFCIRPFASNYVFNFMMIIVLFLAYSIGGYWLFNTELPRRKLIPIASGLVLAFSIFIWPYAIRLNEPSIFQKCCIAANALLSLGLGALLVFSSRLNGIASNIKPIFLRSVVILAITSLFALEPYHFKPYRTLMTRLNHGNKYLMADLKMFDYEDGFIKAYRANDCDSALHYAELEHEAGREWLGLDERGFPDSIISELGNVGLDSNSRKDPELRELLQKMGLFPDLWKIGGTYYDLWNAYDCKASNAYQLGQFDVARIYYLKADTITAPYFQKTRDRSLTYYKVAQCYDKLGDYGQAMSYLTQGIDILTQNKETNSVLTGQLYSEMALALAHIHQIDRSNYLYRTANAIYLSDSSDKHATEELASNYVALSQNLVLQDSMELAMFYIQKALSLEKAREFNYCTTLIYYGTYLTRINAYDKSDSILRDARECLKSNKSTGLSLAFCDYLIGFVDVALARYENARSYISEAKNIFDKSGAAYTDQYVSCITLSAEVNKSLGDYHAATDDYSKALIILSAADSATAMRHAFILSSIAEIEIILDQIQDAKAHSTEALALSKPYLNKDIYSYNPLYNKLAYVSYAFDNLKAADSLYAKVLRINNSNSYYTLSDAVALNGLGLNASRRKEYSKADSLFNKSLRLHRNIVHEKNPLTAQVYINYALLNIEQNKLAEAEEKLNKAQAIDQSFLSADHDVFGDIADAMGDIYRRRGDKIKARGYYQTAISIYKKKFGPEHSKLKNLQRKLL